MTDPQLRKFDLIPTEHQRPGRPHGWAKIHSETAHGAINLEWHGRTGVLTCRVVTKVGHKPHSIIRDVIDYLLARHQSRILAIHIMRRYATWAGARFLPAADLLTRQALVPEMICDC